MYFWKSTQFTDIKSDIIFTDVSYLYINFSIRSIGMHVKPRKWSNFVLNIHKNRNLSLIFRNLVSFACKPWRQRLIMKIIWSVPIRIKNDHICFNKLNSCKRFVPVLNYSYDTTHGLLHTNGKLETNQHLLDNLDKYLKCTIKLFYRHQKNLMLSNKDIYNLHGN